EFKQVALGDAGLYCNAAQLVIECCDAVHSPEVEQRTSGHDRYARAVPPVLAAAHRIESDSVNVCDTNDLPDFLNAAWPKNYRDALRSAESSCFRCRKPCGIRDDKFRVQDFFPVQKCVGERFDRLFRYHADRP